MHFISALRYSVYLANGDNYSGAPSSLGVSLTAPFSFLVWRRPPAAGASDGEEPECAMPAASGPREDEVGPAKISICNGRYDRMWSTDPV
jgi:hypothetical protein